MHDVHADPAAAATAGHDEVEVIVALRHSTHLQVHDGVVGRDEVEASVQHLNSGPTE